MKPDSLAVAKKLSDGKAYFMAYYAPIDLDHIRLFAGRLRKAAFNEIESMSEGVGDVHH